MAAGFEAQGVNSGDVTGPDPDLDAAREFYAARGVTWGLRVPSEHAVAARPAAVHAAGDGGDRARPSAPRPRSRASTCGAPARPTSRACCTSTRPSSASTPSTTRAGSSRCWPREAADVALASSTASLPGPRTRCSRTGRAGRRLPRRRGRAGDARRRGVGAALSSWLLERGFAAGGELAHLNPDTDEAARLYGRLGFTETPGLDIYVEI